MNNIPTPDNVFVSSTLPERITHKADSDITHNDKNITHTKDTTSRDQYGRLLSNRLSKPIIDDLELLQTDFYNRLETVAAPIKTSARTSKQKMKEVIIELCDDHFIEITQLANLLSRTNQNIRQNYLKAMVEDGTLELAFPQSPKTPRQAYCKK